jgi:two-component system cell cycle sensor histidine kinase/response regulator CckA
MVRQFSRPAPPSAADELVRVVRALATMASLFGIVALLGWILGAPAIAGAVARQAPMPPLTAAMVTLASAALLLMAHIRASDRAGRGAALLVLVGSVLVLVEYAFSVDTGLIRLGLDPVVGAVAGVPVRPAPNSALCLVLIAVALLARPYRATVARWRTNLANGCGTIALLVALAVFVGDSYGADVADVGANYPSMALASAFAISLLAFAILLHPARGLIGAAIAGSDAGAMMARRLLPAALLVPFVLGVLKRVADVHQLVAPPIGTALRTISEMVLMVGLALLVARRLRRIDRERERLMAEERDARAEAERAQAALEEQAQELEEQAQELETTVDDLRAANETLDEQRVIAENARGAELQAKRVLDAVIEQIPVGVVLARIPSGEVLRLNRMGEEIVAAFTRGNGGVAKDALTWYRADGRPYTPADYPLSRAIHRAEIIENEEMTTRLSDGSPIHLMVSAAPVYEHSEATTAVAVFADISTRRAAETALAEREALLHSFFRAPNVMVAVIEADLSPEALARADVDYRFLLANAEAASIFGRSETEVAGRSAAELGIPAGDRRSFVNLLAEAQRAGKPVTVERPNYRTVERRGTAPTWFSIIVSPLAVRGDQFPRFCLIGTDISRQRALEDELRQAQKLEAVGRLAGGIAHDFNNLLTAITGFTRFAIADLPVESSIHEDLEQVIRAAERAGALTHQLLAFSRQQMLQPQVLDLNQVVTNIEPMLRRVIGEDIAIHRSLAPTLGSVRADRGQIEQVLVNLVVNARDAMPNGGLVTIETAEVYLEATQVATGQGGSAGPNVMLAVTDTGVGMPAETRDRIFEPFFTTKETGRGTGLGLSTVFGIVRQSGGSIWVYSEPGHGTTFKIYLPRFDGQPEAPRTPTPVSVPRVAGRVLLVEDDSAVRTIAARVLRADGYDVVEATTGREGVEKFRALGGKVHLIVTDLVLPEMGGRAMIQALAAEGAVLPVVYMSGYTAEAMSAQSVLEAGDQFIEKPFTPDAFLAKVRQTMQGGAQESRRAG